MTTLPQTTNVRLPRPSSGAIQIGSQGALGASREAAGTQQQGSNEIWRVIRGHIWMILIVTCIISPLAGWGVNRLLLTYYPRYTATGLIQVLPPTAPSRVVSGDPTQFDTSLIAVELRSQAAILRNESLLAKVLTNQNSDIRRTKWFAQFNGNIPKAKQDFEDELTVTPLQDTKLVKIEFTYSVPVDCQTIVRDLVETHIIEQKQLSSDTLLDRTSMLGNVKVTLEARNRDLTNEMKRWQIQLNDSGGGSVGVGGHAGVKDIELSKLVQEQVEAQLMFNKARGLVEATGVAINQGQDPPGMEIYVQRSNPYLIQEEYGLKQIDIERDLLLEQLGPENARVKQLIKRAEIMRTQYQTELDAARGRARVTILDEMQQDANNADNKLQGLQKRVEALKLELGDLNNALVQYLTLQEEQRGVREHLKTVKEQIENVMALNASTTAATVQWRAMPEVPMNKSFPKLPITMTLAIALGLALSLGVAFLREAMDQSIRSPRDIAKVGQINLLGMIPDESDDPQSAGARLPVVIFDAPHSIMAESFRHIRTKLQHTASLDTTRSIMVTSPSPGDGKTTIACNLAAGLALNGRRILLVDANFRRPEVHKIFGLSNEQGFSDVLNAVAAFDEVIQETQVPNLAVMAAGPKPMNPTELFESQLLIDFIERALEEFDHVIFDSGPIMVVAEAQAMAPRVDGVISVVRAKTNNRGLLQRMRDELRKNKAEHLGVVLNAVRAQGGGYYARNIQTYYDYANNGHG